MSWRRAWPSPTPRVAGRKARTGGSGAKLTPCIARRLARSPRRWPRSRNWSGKPWAPRIRGAVLRYGFFYGPGTSYAAGGSIAADVRRRRFPVLGDRAGGFFFIHVRETVTPRTGKHTA